MLFSGANASHAFIIVSMMNLSLLVRCFLFTISAYCIGLSYSKVEGGPPGGVHGSRLMYSLNPLKAFTATAKEASPPTTNGSNAARPIDIR